MRSSKAIVICGMTIALAILIYGASRRSLAGSSPSIAVIDKSVIRKAPDFELKTLDGRSVKLSDFRGRAVVLNFWATYCAPCRAEMPWLIDLYQQYRSRGLEIIGVSMDDDGEQQRVADFLREVRVNYTILLGNRVVGDAYGGVRFLPQTFFIDRKGQITGSAVGMKSKQEFEIYIKQLLSASDSTSSLSGQPAVKVGLSKYSAEPFSVSKSRHVGPRVSRAASVESGHSATNDRPSRSPSTDCLYARSC